MIHRINVVQANRQQYIDVIPKRLLVRTAISHFEHMADIFITENKAEETLEFSVVMLTVEDYLELLGKAAKNLELQRQPMANYDEGVEALLRGIVIGGNMNKEDREQFIKQRSQIKPDSNES